MSTTALRPQLQKQIPHPRSPKAGDRVRDDGYERVETEKWRAEIRRETRLAGLGVGGGVALALGAGGSQVDGLGLGDEVQVGGLGEERGQAAEIFFVQAEIYVFGQVALEFVGGEVEIGGGLGADFGEAAQAEIARGLEIGDDFGGGDFAAGGPDGQDGGESGHAAPLLDYVVDVQGAVVGDAGAGSGADLFAGFAAAGAGLGGEAEAQGGIADQQGGVGAQQHRREVGRHLEEFGRDLPLLLTENSRQRLGAAGTAVERDVAGFLERNLGNQQQAADARFRRDGHVREDHEVVDALVFNGGDDGDVGGVGA
jgi:hypothetical protein